MSKVVDERVVSMEFDNSRFERNVKTSMSTLDKLKQSLSFKGATDGFKKLDSAAKGVNMSGLGTAVEEVRMRFSALEVMGVTALANITNSAINTGKSMIKALTLDPVISGFHEYETQINAVQTILANTQSKGSTLEDVNKALDELNKYADMTIYNFTEMTKNIGTFTAAGVDLDKSVTSIKGIANLAAVSGSTSQQASTAMYQLSQALAAGKVQLMDWNSVVNAGMGGEVFQTALKRTATQMGYNVDALIEKYGSFRESLTKGGWLTAEVLTETLTQLSGAYSEADLIAQGYSEKQAKEIAQLAQTAVDAATKVKTFTQLWDTLKEAAQSGWTQTWEIVIGDFEEAKELLTGISDFLGNAINESSTRRNNLLEAALGGSESKWDSLIQKVNDAGVSTDAFEKKIRELAIASGMSGDKFDSIVTKAGSLANAFKQGLLPISLIKDAIKSFAQNLDKATTPITATTENLEKFQKAVNKTINGDFGNGAERIEKLTKAGYNNVAVQKLVNKVWEKNGKTWKDTTITSEDLTEVINSLSKEELKSIGYTDEQAKKLKELAKQAEETGTPINNLIESLNKPSGRELLIDTFKRSLMSIYRVFDAIGSAWRDVFSIDASQLYNAIEMLNDFAKAIEFTDEDAAKLQRTFKGLFAVLNIFTSIAGTGFKVAFKLLTAVLDEFDLGILDVTANIGDALVKVNELIFDNEIINKGFDLLAKGIKVVVDKIKELVDAFGSLPIVKQILSDISNIDFLKVWGKIAEESRKAADAIGELIEAFKNLPMVQNVLENISGVDLTSIGGNIIEGLYNGLKDGITKIPGIMIEIGTTILNTIKAVLGIHSPSTEAHEVGTNFIEGLVNGIKDGLSKVAEIIKAVGSTMLDTIADFDWGKIAAIAATVGLLLFVKKIVGILDAIVAPLQGVGDVLSGVGDVLSKSAKNISKVIKGFANLMNSLAFSIAADGIKSIALSIALLAGSIFLLSKIDSGKLWESIGAIAALSAILGVLAFAVSKMNIKGGGMAKLGVMLLGMSISLLILSKVVKILGGMNPQQAQQGFLGLAGMIVALGVVIAAYGKLVDAKSSENISKLGSMMLKMSIALLLMVGVVKLIGMLSAGELIKGGLAITAFVGIIALLGKVSNTGDKDISKLGSMMIKFSIALLLMVGVIKLIGTLSAGDLIKGGIAITAFVGIIALLSMVSKIGGVAIKGLGTTMLSMSVSMLLMIAVMKLLGTLSAADVIKGGLAITAFLGVITVMTKITNLAGKNTGKMASTLLAMSVAIGILAGVAILLSLIDLSGLAKGILAIAALSAIMAGLIYVTKYAKNTYKNILAMALVIGVMAASIAALSFIDPSSLAGATSAMALLMGMFALILKSSGAVTGSMGPLIVMTVAIGLIGGILITLSTLPVTSVMGTAVSLSALLLALSASLMIVSKIPLAGATQGALALVAFVGILAVALAALGALYKIPGVQDLVQTGGQLLADLGYAIGNFVGSIIGGLSAGVSSGLPTIAENLSAFGQGIQPFISSMSGIDAGSLITNVAALSGAIIALTAADILAAISSFLQGGSSFVSMGTDLSLFMNAIQPFIAGAKQLDAGMLQGVNSLAKTILILTAADILDGLTSWITGGASLTEFGEQLAPFGASIKAFSDSVRGIDETAVSSAANAGKMLAEMASTIPNSGGLLGKILGENDVDTFGAQLKSFGESIVAFSQIVSGNIDQGAVEAAAAAGDVMVALAKDIPNTGGLLGLIMGENNMDTFGTQLKSFGESIASFSESVKGRIDQSAVEAAAAAGNVMVALSKDVDNSGGLLGLIMGENDLESFGTQITKFGQGIVDFSDTVSTVNPSQITNALNSATRISDSIKATVDLDTSGIKSFKEAKTIGETIKSYSDKVADINISNINGSITAIKNLISSINSMSSINTSGVESFKSAISSLGQTQLNSFTDTFTKSSSAITSIGSGLADNIAKGVTSRSSSVSKSAQDLVSVIKKAFTSENSNFSKAGSDLMSNVDSGMSSKRSAISSTVSSIISTAAMAIGSYTSVFYNAGAQLVNGFANGISANSYKAAAQARAMASAAATAAKKALDVHSPSRVFYGIGDFAGKGFVNALSDYKQKSYKASYSMATYAKEGLTNAIGKISDYLNGNIDPNPVIRPVLDLSEIESRASAIGSLLNNDVEIGASATVRTIGSMMNNRQNGNNEIVSAISKLRRDLGNVPKGNTYVVNGVTYDDGSNVSNAVGELIRAARIERRI